MSGMRRYNATTTSTQNTIVLMLKQRWSEQTVKENKREDVRDKNQKYEDEKTKL